MPDGQDPTVGVFDAITRVKVDTLEKSVKGVWDKVDELRNRPPTWVVFAMSVMSLILGACLHHLWG